jgi:hypothetical protein
MGDLLLVLLRVELHQEFGVGHFEKHGEHSHITRSDREHLAVEVLSLDLNPLKEQINNLANVRVKTIDRRQIDSDATGSNRLHHMGCVLRKELVHGYFVAVREAPQAREGKTPFSTFVCPEHGGFELTVCGTMDILKGHTTLLANGAQAFSHLLVVIHFPLPLTTERICPDTHCDIYRSKHPVPTAMNRTGFL